MPLLKSVKKYKDYLGISPKAEDFNEYWKEAIKEMKTGDFSYELVEKNSSFEGIEIYDLYFSGVLGGKMHCELLKPRDVKEKIPGLMMYHGYSSNIDSLYSKVPYVYNNMAVLALDVAGQGGRSEDIHTAIGPTVYGQLTRGVADKDKNKLFYRSVFLDAVKASMILANFDFVDETRLASTGKSQGGALSLISAAFNKGIKVTAPMYPFLGDYLQLFNSDIYGDIYKEFINYFRKYDTLHEHEDEFFERLSYVDVKNFADRIEAKVLMITALMDNTCPPITQFAIYNNLKCQKDLVLYPDYDHERLPYSDDIIFKFIKENI